jgi:hypothetical protein
MIDVNANFGSAIQVLSKVSSKISGVIANNMLRHAAHGRSGCIGRQQRALVWQVSSRQ